MAVYRRGGVWWFEFWFQGRRIQESSGQTNKTAAQRVQAKRKADLLDRRAGFSQKKLAPKFDAQVKDFLAWSKTNHRPKTRDLHETNCNTLLRFFRRKYLDEITPGLVEQFKLTRIGEKRRNAKDGSTVAGATINRALTTLKLLYNHAERCGFDISNPTNGVKFFNEGSGRMRVVTFAEELLYLMKASQPLADIARIILDTGLRPEEVFRMRVENIDFEAHTIFNPFGKTKAARRTVTMTAEVCGLLKTRVQKAEVSLSSTRAAIPSSRSALFGRLTEQASRTPDQRPLPALRPANTFATRAVAAGVDLVTLSSILGYTKITMTMRYVHPAEERRGGDQQA